MVSQIRRELAKLLRGKRDTTYVVGGIPLVLPYHHKLPEYQRKFRLYDRKLGLIAQTVRAIHPDAIGIDIGANVGDSAAAIRGACDMPLLCIEADPVYYGYLSRNAERIGGVTCVRSLVGLESRSVSARIDRRDGTGVLVDASGTVMMHALPDIVRSSGTNTTSVGFIKSDTDGFDFDVVVGSEPILRQVRPTLYFEYQVVDTKSSEASLEAVGLLASIGYRFIVFDNYGHTMRVIQESPHGAFSELNGYVLSGATYGGGIPYLDVFASADSSVFDTFKAKDAQLSAGGCVVRG